MLGFRIKRGGAGGWRGKQDVERSADAWRLGWPVRHDVILVSLRSKDRHKTKQVDSVSGETTIIDLRQAGQLQLKRFEIDRWVVDLENIEIAKFADYIRCFRQTDFDF